MYIYIYIYVYTHKNISKHNTPHIRGISGWRNSRNHLISADLQSIPSYSPQKRNLGRDRWVSQMVLTSMPRRFLHRTHLLNPGRQYSTKYSSVYSTPWPLPNLPCVLVDVNKRGVCRFTSKYSLPSLVTIFFGHQAPPPLSCRSLTNEGIMPRVITYPLARITKGTSHEG